MQSHILNMLFTSVIIGTCFHVFYYDKDEHPWHHHFLVYFFCFFVLGVGFAWIMFGTAPPNYYE